MAKNSITDYSKTASLNTDIQSVDIDEACLPSGINNAIRELMADLAAVNDGTVALTSPAFTSVDINSGTIDGVTIGGASAAAGTFTTFTSTGIDDNASSTAVTINSSNNVGIGTSLPQTLLEIASGNSGNDAALDSPTFRINNTTESADWDIGDAIGTIEYYSSDSSGNSPYVTSFIKSVNDTGDGTLPSGALTFGTATYNEVGGAVERLRIDSSGNVGVGISNPSSYGPFVVSGTGAVGNFNASSGAALVQLYENGAGRFGIQTLNGSAGAKFTVAGSEKIRIDSSGRVGIGTSSNLNDQLTVGTSFDGFTASVNGAVSTIRLGGHDISAAAGRFDYDRATGLLTYKEGTYNSEGSALLTVTNSGQVGIGDSNPLSILHVGSGLDANVPITLAPSTGGNVEFRNTSGTGTFTFTNANGSSERMRIDGSGRVGIGTSSPDTKFHVEESGAADLYATFENSNPGGYGAFVDIKSTANFSFSRFTGGTKSWIIGQRGLAGGAFSIYDQDNSAHRLVIDGSGNVGIGTSSPNGKLEVGMVSSPGGSGFSGGTDFIHLLATAGSAFGEPAIKFQEAGTDIGCVIAGKNTANGAMNIVFANRDTSSTTSTLTERARLDASGNLLVGTTAAEGPSKLAVVQTNTNQAVIGCRHTLGAGENFVRFINSSNTAVIGTIVNSGNTGTAYNTSSDYRLKEDMQPMTGAIERVNALNPINFAWKVDGSRVDGFLAHEAQAVVPESVTGTKDAMRDEEYEVTPAVYEDVIIPAVLDDEGNETEPERTEQRLVTEAVIGTRQIPDYQGIDQSKLVPLLTAALQEAIAKIETLETKVAALENA